MFCQATLFAGVDVEHRSSAEVLASSLASAERVQLDETSWVDVHRAWLPDADEVFAHLVGHLPWQQRRAVPMYDRLVDEPRLTCWWRAASDRPEPLLALATVRRVLSDHYGRAFDSIGFNLYRDGADSVAWHGDRHRYQVVDPVVAIVSVGAPRPLRLRPNGRVRPTGCRATPQRSRVWELGHGDLFVMGGACQHDWQHAVPKVARAIGARISITYRHGAADITATATLR